ncbi:ATP-grasp domain-containing protein [Pedobacter sandarakinus]|uniref:hypothetical protein n=1 Tax=Pedobacter sandarakinus TaxID=353156 RepID=UPI002246D9C5|nr:hypothetical protein [Pedobacter sandarakinus]MCX2574829.1 hypothetical protein [Pedobacter sandarakinus]
MKILITGGNNAKALKLMKAFPNHFVLLADYGDVPGFATQQYAFASLGVLNKDSIAHILLNFCITESIDSIIPLYPYEAEALAKSVVLFEEYGIQVLAPNGASVSKYLTSDVFSTKHFAVFVGGECIFCSGGEIFVKQADDVNGVFGYNDPDDDLRLFTI